MHRVRVAALAAGLAASGAWAQVRTWASAASGNWATAANWSGTNVPDTLAESATIDPAGTYTVTMSLGHTVGGISMPRTNPVLTIQNSATMTLGGGGLTCNGVVNLVGGAVGNTQIAFGVAGTPLSGTGILELDGDPSNAASSRLQGVGGSIVIGPDFTVRGDGVLFVPMSNSGTISANHAGEVLTVLAPVDNAGTLRAGGGGVLRINAGVTTSGGQITANGGTVEFASSSCTGCLMNTVNGGLISLAAENATINYSGMQVLTGGTFAVQSGGTARINTTPFYNDGVITVNPGAGPGVASIECTTAIQFSGSGTILLNAPAANRSLARLHVPNPSFASIINQGLSTVGGVGVIDGHYSHNGVLKPGVPGSAGTLEFQLTYAASGTAVTEFDIFGRAPGQYDTIEFTSPTGSKFFNGTLRLVCRPGYTPATGDTFTLVTAAGGLQNGFDSVEVTGTPRLVQASVSYTTTSVVVTFDHVCRGVDFNNDTLFPDTQDIADFLTVFSGGVCSTGDCDPIDFNTDTIFPDTVDIEAFLSVFSGGPCL
ncbi:MAG: hypothetical protein U0637_01395 [Phycisphaerales bacterium]